MTFSIKTIIKPILSLFVATALMSSSLFAKEMTQEERNEMAAKLIPIITMLLMDDGDKVAPVKPTLTKAIPSDSTQDTLLFELNGEVGADVYVDGNKTSTIGTDGKVRMNLHLQSGQNSFSIKLKDKAGNTSEALGITILYDVLPKISLLGKPSLTLKQNASYVDAGAIASDKEDGNLTSEINIVSSVDTGTVGTYSVTYSVVDSKAHSVSVTRDIEVIALEEVATQFTVVDSNLSTDEQADLIIQGLIEDSEGNTGSIGGLTDVVATNTITYSDENGNDVEDARIVFRSFNIGEWIGKLNEETTLLARIFMHPYLIALPEDTKIAYVQYLKDTYNKDMNETLKYQNLANESDFFSPRYYDMVSSLQDILENKYASDLAAQQSLQKIATKRSKSIMRKYVVGDDSLVNMALMQLEADDDGETVNFYNYADVYYGLRLHKVGDKLQLPAEYPTLPSSKLHLINPVSGGAVGGLYDWFLKTKLSVDIATSGTVKYNTIMNVNSDVSGQNTALIELYKWKYKTLDYTTIMNSAKGISLILKTVLSFDKGKEILGELEEKLRGGVEILGKAESTIHAIDFALTIGDASVQIMSAVVNDDVIKARLKELSNNIQAYDKTVSTLYNTLNVQPYSADVDKLSSLNIIQKLFGGLLVDIDANNAATYIVLNAKIDALPKNTTQGIKVLGSAAFLKKVIHAFIESDQAGKDKIKAFNDKYKADTISFNQMPYYLALRQAGLIEPSDIGSKMNSASITYGKTFMSKKVISSIGDSFLKYLEKMGSLAKSMNFIKKYTSNAISGVKDKSLYEVSIGLGEWLIESEIINVKAITGDGLKMMALKATAKLNPLGAGVKVAEAVNDWSSYLVGNFGISNSQYFQVDFTNGSVKVSLPPVSYLGLGNETGRIKPKTKPLNYLIAKNIYLASIGGTTGTVGHTPTVKLYFQESYAGGVLLDGDLEDLLETDKYKNKIIFDFDLHVDKAKSNILQETEYEPYINLKNINISSENIISADLSSGENGASSLDLMEAWADKGTNHYLGDDDRGIFKEYVTVRMKPSLDADFVVDEKEPSTSQKITGYKVWNKSQIENNLALSTIVENSEKKTVSVVNNATYPICYEVKYEIDVPYTPYDRLEYDSGCIEAGGKENLELYRYKDTDDTFNSVVFYFYDGLAKKFFDAIKVPKPYLSTYSKLHYDYSGYVIAYSINLEDIVEVSNLHPVANAGEMQVVAEGDTVVLDGSASADADGSIVSYEWTNDAGYTISREVQASPLATLVEGNYTYTLTVKDDSGYTATDTVWVVVDNHTSTSTTTLKKTGQTTSYYTGDDGTYQTGVTPSYSRANEVVTDHVTGLEWQDDAEAKTVTKNWVDAQTHCSALGLDGGGWRLPSRKELVSLSDYGRSSPAIDPVFTNVASYFYWSSTTSAGRSSLAWGVYFYDGYQGSYRKSYSFYVRCVRAGQ
jgi:hypothetical protein